MERIVADAIETVVRAHLSGVEIVRVESSASLDSDGVLEVWVVYDDASGALDPAETAQLARHVWGRLVELGADVFPSLSFISRSDAGKRAAA